MRGSPCPHRHSEAFAEESLEVVGVAEPAFRTDGDELAVYLLHALEGISTAHVVAQLRISRSLLDLRFRQLRNESVMDAILSIRLAAVKERVEKTERKFIAIGAECGFRNPDYLKRLFSKRFGMSMRAWRATHRKTK